MPRNARAFEVEADDGGRNISQPGAYHFLHYENPEVNIGIIHGCPCGCGESAALFFRGLSRGQQEWDVLGEWPNVTLFPSIGIRYGRGTDPSGGGYHWHGYLRNGVFEEC
jgi:hypothetical protein